MNKNIRIPYATLCTKICNRLVAAGMSSIDADIEARIMVDADLLEVPSHGVRMLPELLLALADGRLSPTPHIKTEREFGAICVVDYGNGPGRNTSAAAMRRAMGLAEIHGVGVCLAKRTSHWGRAHAYAHLAAQEGFIGLCTTNAIPSMAIGGAKARIIGNNPLAIGIPAANTNEPIVLDMAMSQAAVGKVKTWLREGRKIPANWGIDATGNSSADAADILAGAVIPMGEHKGAGLAVMLELLTAALAGAAFGFQLLEKDKSGIDPDSTKIFIALKVTAFGDKAAFAENVAAFLHYLAREAAFQFPGERGWRVRQDNLGQGVPLHTEIVGQLTAAGIQF